MPDRRATTSIESVTVVAHDIGPFGGMESQLATLVERLLARGVAVVAIGSRVDLAPDPLLTVVRARVPQRPFPIKYAAFFLLGSFAVARHRSGPVYTIGAITFNRADARKVPFCHVAWAARDHLLSRASRHSLPYRINSAISGAMSRAAEHLLYRPSLTGSLVAMSGDDAAELEHFFPKMAPVERIPNGVDTERFAADSLFPTSPEIEREFSDADLVAAFVGGDWQRKGLPQVIEALASSPRWTLAVAGEGDRDAMRRLAGRFRVADRVRLLGRIDQPEALFARADALAMPSVYEPWGNAVLEACACGLPVVVAPASGVNDFVADQKNGLIVDPTATAVASALSALENPALRARIGTGAAEMAKQYSYDRVADDYLSLFSRDASPSAATAKFAAT